MSSYTNATSNIQPIDDLIEAVELLENGLQRLEYPHSEAVSAENANRVNLNNYKEWISTYNESMFGQSRRVSVDSAVRRLLEQEAAQLDAMLPFPRHLVEAIDSQDPNDVTPDTDLAQQMISRDYANFTEYSGRIARKLDRIQGFHNALLAELKIVDSSLADDYLGISDVAQYEAALRGIQLPDNLETEEIQQ